MTACCSPSRNEGTGTSASAPALVSAAPADQPVSTEAIRSTAKLVQVAGGEFTMGDNNAVGYPGDGEEQADVTVAPFSIGATSVTNAEFAEFVTATGHLTDAQRYGWSFVFAGLLPDDFSETRGVAGAEWWRQVFGATWKTPEGPHSDVGDREHHPVVHVSYSDSLAFAQWCGARLPTEAEWEFAARGGTTTIWPWGDEREPDGDHRMNVFQGTFPHSNTAADGWNATCPVDTYMPNVFGMYNMVGNVWEWTADAFSVSARHLRVDSDSPVLLKGGSFLCHDSYCRRYRPAARMGSAADSSSSNMGLRLAG